MHKSLTNFHTCLNLLYTSSECNWMNFNMNLMMEFSCMISLKKNNIYLTNHYIMNCLVKNDIDFYRYTML